MKIVVNKLNYLGEFDTLGYRVIRVFLMPSVSGGEDGHFRFELVFRRISCPGGTAFSLSQSGDHLAGIRPRVEGSRKTSSSSGRQPSGDLDLDLAREVRSRSLLCQSWATSWMRIPGMGMGWERRDMEKILGGQPLMSGQRLSDEVNREGQSNQ